MLDATNLSSVSQYWWMMLCLYCQQGGRTERTDKEFTTHVVDVECAIVRNAATDTAATGDTGKF